MSNQYLKLRRSNVQGRIPTTESIDFGEIALNTYDGVAYMKKSGSNGIEVVPIGSSTGSLRAILQEHLVGRLAARYKELQVGHKTHYTLLIFTIPMEY